MCIEALQIFLFRMNFPNYVSAHFMNLRNFKILMIDRRVWLPHTRGSTQMANGGWRQKKSHSRINYWWSMFVYHETK